MFDSIDSVASALAEQAYIADEGLATSLFLALRMERPVFLEGEPGVGKTEIAKVLSRALDTPLIRLQCYEGLDLAHALYEWNYPRQLLEIQARRSGERADGGDGAADDLFSEKYLLKRPLLQAIDAAHDRAPVLLIDELDRADEEFESFLLEILSDFQVTIPELGTLRARHKPVTILTSNRTREIHDALKRRCVYHWIDYPSRAKELEIVRAKLPGVGEELAAQVVDFVQALREEDLYKLPGVAETLDWARALERLGTQTLDVERAAATLGAVVKYREDAERVRMALERTLTFDEAGATAPPAAATTAPDAPTATGEAPMATEAPGDEPGVVPLSPARPKPQRPSPEPRSHDGFRWPRPPSGDGPAGPASRWRDPPQPGSERHDLRQVAHMRDVIDLRPCRHERRPRRSAARCDATRRRRPARIRVPAAGPRRGPHG